MNQASDNGNADAMNARPQDGEMAHAMYRFGEFEFRPRQRLLLRGGARVALGSRALDILAVLLEAAGEIVSKDDLLAKVWPSVHVEETSLRVHIAAIRRALDGKDGSLIGTVPGRGYAFVGNLRSAPAPAGRAGSLRGAPPAAKRSLLPHPVNHLIGRDDVVAAIAAQLEGYRCVSVTGPGGIGKTSVALAAALRLQNAFGEGSVFVDLSPVEDAAFVPARLAAALDVPVAPGKEIADLAVALRNRELLIVLDNCEHVIAAAAALVEGLLRGTGMVRILATSREPLRVEGEWVQRLSALGLPRQVPGLSVEEAMAFPAIQLFVERAAQGLGGFTLGYGDAARAAEICRSLDGNPLAIEFAASRLGSLGLHQLAAQLDDRFRLLQSGRRTALPRQQTLRAMLDWSYDLLTEGEQLLLMRLSHFQSSFTFEAAIGVCAACGFPADEVPKGIFELVEKSLVTTTREQPEVRYRLLDTTRAYGREKLQIAGEIQRTARAHARYLLSVFERLSPGREPFAFLERHGEEAPEVEELRSALKWAFSAHGDTTIGVGLTITALPLWWQLSLIDESLVWVERALAIVDGGADANPRLAMILHSALGGLQMYATARVRNAREEWEKTHALAVALGDVEFQLRALRALWSKSLNEGEFALSLGYGQQFRTTAQVAGMAREAALAGRFIGTAEHFMGRHVDAERSTEEMLMGYFGTPREDIVRFQFDQRISARLVSGRIPALRGLFDTAMAAIERDVEDALSIDHTLTTCCLLSQSACPIALLAEDYEAFARYQQILKDLTDSRALDIWNQYAVCFDAMLLIAEGAPAEGLSRLEPAIENLHKSGFDHFRTSFLLARHNALEALGRNTEAVLSIDEALAICTRTGEAWLLPELLRVRASHRELHEGEAALKDYQAAWTMAAAQGALTWELKIASNLTRLEAHLARPGDGRSLLADALERCVEGQHRKDYLEGKRLLVGID